LTVVELVISLTVLAVVLLGLGMVVSSGTKSYQTGVTATQLQQLSQRAVDRMAEELLEAGVGTIAPQVPNTGDDQINFRVNTGFNGANIVFGPETTLTMQMFPGELDNGVDDNSNGLVDERQVVRIVDPLGPDPQTVVLSRWVRELFEGELPNGNDDNGNGLIDEPGFSVLQQGRAITLRLTLERADPEGRVVTSSAETVVRVRN
jgi:hypothetical protein